MSLPVSLYHIQIGSSGEPAATTMSQTGCYMDESFLMCLLQKIYNYTNGLSNRLHSIQRDKTEQTPAEETTDKTGAILETSPWQQVVQTAQQTDMSASSAQTTITLLHVNLPGIQTYKCLAHGPNNIDSKVPVTFMQCWREKQTPHSFHALCETAFTARIVITWVISYHAPQVKNYSWIIGTPSLVSWDH